MLLTKDRSGRNLSKMIITAALFTAPLVMVGTQAHAQKRSEPQTVIAIDIMLAEHAQWEADHAAWQSQHLEIAARLEKLAAKLRSEGAMFAADAMILEKHGEKLKAAGSKAEMMTLVSNHARAASKHIEAARSHHELLDEVRALEARILEDRTQEASDVEE